ncbi:hypothetical protein N7G274_000209 [Stereocaulon virgatum]|uniref:Uncharacterized protein n=1 Tax=Stereocaulon virgatum TaxID=373712 RepID=A0ABR4ARH2_9LECA
MTTNPLYATAGFSPISDADSPARRDRKLSLLNTLSRFQPQIRRSRSDKAGESPISTPVDQPEESIDSQIENSYYFGHAWTFWHDKHAPSGDYEGRLTLLQDDITTVKLFWEVINSFPLQRLGFKDSVHFFKRGVKPVWEDLRNVNGGSWTFRVPREKTDQFWKELLVLAVGEEFFDVVQKGDDICGLSLSMRYNGNTISIWHRDATNEKSKDGILAVILDKLSPELKPTQQSHIYYKKHSTHPGFDSAVAQTKEAEKAGTPSSSPGGGTIPETEVKIPEGKRAMWRDTQR